jgi:hypothetical protein
MRMNIKSWDESGGGKVLEDLTFALFGVLDDHLGPARVKGVKDLEMFWVTPSVKSAKRGGAPRVMELRYFPARHKVTCRVMLSPPVPEDDRRWPAYRVAFVREVERRTAEVVAGIVERLRESGVEVDLSRATRAMERDFAKLAKPPKKTAAKKTAAKKTAAKKRD